MLTGRGRPHPKVSGPGQPPTSVRLQRSGAGGSVPCPGGGPSSGTQAHLALPAGDQLASGLHLCGGGGETSPGRAGLAGGGAALGACPLLKAPWSGCCHPQGWESAELVFQHPGQGWATVLTLPSPRDSGLQDSGQRRPATPAPATASARLPGESCSFLDLCLLVPPVSQVSGALLDCPRGHPALPGS